MASKPTKIDKRAWKRFADKLKAAEGAHVKVGVMSSSGRTADNTMSMVELAAIHELGSPKARIPERSFIRSTFEKNKIETGRVTAKLAKQFVEGKMSLAKALGVLGAWGVAQVKNTIARGPHLTPPLKPATIARKGSDRPLVDTGRLLGSIQHEVVGGGTTGRGGFRK